MAVERQRQVLEISGEGDDRAKVAVTPSSYRGREQRQRKGQEMMKPVLAFPLSPIALQGSPEASLCL